MKVWLVEVRNEESENTLIDIAATEAVGLRRAARLIRLWFGNKESLVENAPLIARAMRRGDYARVCDLWREDSNWNMADVTEITVEE